MMKVSYNKIFVSVVKPFYILSFFYLLNMIVGNNIFAANKNVWIDFPVNTRSGQEDLIVCPNELVEFSAVQEGHPSGSTWTWQNAIRTSGATETPSEAEKSFSSGNNYVTATYDGEVSYAVKVIVRTIDSVTAKACGKDLVHAIASSTVVSFTSSVQMTPSGGALNYLWDFGDGSTSTSANPTHIYSAGGVKNVTCKVRCGTGPWSTDTVTVHVISGITINSPTALYSPGIYKMSFNDSNTVAGHANPSSLPSCCDELIDWDLDDVPTADCKLEDSASGNLNWTANWPTSNSAWGSGDALNASINKSRLFRNYVVIFSWPGNRSNPPR